MNYLLLIFIGIMGIFYGSTFRWLIESWLNNPYYSHGFLVPIISGFIIWRKKDDLLKIEKKRSQIGLIVFFGGIILEIIATQLSIRFISGLSLIVTIFGTILYLSGWELINKIKFPIFFLLMAIPIPFVDIVASPAQLTSAVVSTELGNLIGISVQRDGFILMTPNGKFEVGLECSGLKSMISLLTVSIIFAYILEGKIIMKSIIVLLSIPFAMIANILRITSILTVAQEYGKDVAIVYFHDFSNPLLFITAFIGIVMVGRCFGRLKFKKIF